MLDILHNVVPFSPSWPAVHSCCSEFDVEHIGWNFPVLDFVRNYTERQCLHFTDGLLDRPSIGKCAWKLLYLSQPTTIILLLAFNGEFHDLVPKLRVPNLR